MIWWAYICFLFNSDIHLRLKSNFPEEYSRGLYFLIWRSVADSYLHLFGREIPKFNQKAWRKYLFLENLCKDMLHIYFSTYFYIKGSKSCLKTSYKKCCMRIISCLIDSSRQGSLKSSGPEGDQSEIRNQSCEGAL